MNNSTLEIKPTSEQQTIIGSKESTIVVYSGTGKTTALDLKVMDLLESGVNSEEILCITFITKAKKMFDKIYSMAQGKFSDSKMLKEKFTL